MKYSLICVGGPWAGRVVATDGPEFTIYSPATVCRILMSNVRPDEQIGRAELERYIVARGEISMSGVRITWTALVHKSMLGTNDVARAIVAHCIARALVPDSRAAVDATLCAANERRAS